MTFQEFLAAVTGIAGDRYHSAGVEVVRSTAFYSRRKTAHIKWSAYIGNEDGGESWVGATPEAVLAQMRGATESDIAAIGEVA